MERVACEHGVGRITGVLVAQETSLDRFDALLAHGVDHGLRDVDSDHPPDVRSDGAREGARPGPEVDDSAHRSNSERLHRR